MLLLYWLPYRFYIFMLWVRELFCITVISPTYLPSFFFLAVSAVTSAVLPRHDVDCVRIIVPGGSTVRCIE